MPKAEIEARVRDMLAQLRLEGLGARRPHQLSGGQRQRVALARALVKRPRAFLLDEPLAALDRRLREDTRFELMELQEKLRLTFIVVTHDQEEAMTVADRIGVMNRGRLEQVAPPSEVYEQPATRWVADFIGDVNLFEGRVAAVAPNDAVIETAGHGRMRVAQTLDAAPGATVWVALRPEKIQLAAQPPVAQSENCLSGRVHDIAYLGDASVYKVRLDDGRDIKATAANRQRLIKRPIAFEERVWLTWPAEAAVVLTR
jgi:putrescine transport system ATP-binding protein